MTWYCINNKKRDDGTASAKAPDDIFKISQSLGCEEIIFYQPKKYKSLNMTRFLAFFTGLGNWNRLLKTTQKDSVILLQHPNENIIVANRMIDYCKKTKNLRFVAIIHDLDSLRKSFSLKNPESLDNRNNLADEVLLKKCDYIICHNENMKVYLISRGFDERKLISLGIFDYLHSCVLPEKRHLTKSIVVAGNLTKDKCNYLYQLIKIKRNYVIHLFGPNYTCDRECDNVIYHGIFPADELPSKLIGDFGLIWDGMEIDTCSGSTGEYIRYNNPHKVSLFLSSNMPVIIWKEAALARFIKENHLGIVVNSLTEIDSIIENMTQEEYQEMLGHVKHVGLKLRGGFYLTEALKKVHLIVSDE